MSTLVSTRNGIQTKLLWAAIIALGAVSFGIVALSRGETVNAASLVMAALCIYFVAYRFYALFIAEKVLGLDPTRQTPAYRHNDGLDYVPTNRDVLFGHHFAAIAGAGPLVGPVLAAQMGYLPGTLWILAGVVFAGAVQDLTLLFLSTRRDGRSLGDMVRSEMGPIAGGIALVGVLLIMIILLAVLALVVVKALVGSPWRTFTVFCTVPIALLMGVYARFVLAARSHIGWFGGDTWPCPPRWYQDSTAHILPDRLRQGFELQYDSSERNLVRDALASIRRFYPMLPERLRHVGPYQEARERPSGRAGPDVGTQLLNRLWIGQPWLA